MNCGTQMSEGCGHQGLKVSVAVGDLRGCSAHTEVNNMS